jgi:hypothetical protein
MRVEKGVVKLFTGGTFHGLWENVPQDPARRRWSERRSCLYISASSARSCRYSEDMQAGGSSTMNQTSHEKKVSVHMPLSLLSGGTVRRSISRTTDLWRRFRPSDNPLRVSFGRTLTTSRFMCVRGPVAHAGTIRWTLLATLALFAPLCARATLQTDHWALLSFTSPPNRSGASFVYDVRRNRLLLFGGSSQQGVIADVWSFDLGTRTWSGVTTSGPRPPARTRHSAVYDSQSDRMIVYGGSDGATLFGDLYALDLKTLAWSALTPTGTVPGPRARHDAIYDKGRNRMVVFGGVTAGGLSDDLYALDLASLVWTTIVPDRAIPEPRQSAGMAYDAAADRLLLFGGGGAGERFLNDTWVFSVAENEWARLNPTGQIPSPRMDVNAAFDSLNGRFIVFGGTNGVTASSDVYMLIEGVTTVWQKLIPVGTPPLPRSAAAAPTELIDERLYVFGGEGAGGVYFGDAFSFLIAPSTWEPVPAANMVPPLRTAAVAINDAAHNSMLLFGGWTGTPGSAMNDTWRLSYGAVGLPALSWTQVATQRFTPVRYGAAAVFDPDSARMIVLCGSRNDTAYTNDVWALSVDSLTWRQIVPTGGPPAPRTGAAAAWDPLRHRIVLFGGVTAGTAPTQTVRLNDTWILDLHGPTWTQVNTDSAAARPSPRLRMAAYGDDARDRLLVTCGLDTVYAVQDSIHAYNDTWAFYYSSQKWVKLPVGGDLAPRFDAQWALVPGENRMVLFGGAVAGRGNSNELWSLDFSTLSWVLDVPPGTPPSPRAGYTMVADMTRRWIVLYGGTGDQGLLPDGGILYQAGFDPITSAHSDAESGVLDGPHGTLTLRARPRPAGATEFHVQGASGVLTLDLFSAGGRQVWSATRVHAGGALLVRWNGLAANGAQVPSGVYLARVTSRAGSATTKFVRLR